MEVRGRYHESIVFPANHLANVGLLTKPNDTKTQPNKPKQVNIKTPLVCSYSNNTQSGNEVAPFGEES